MQAVREDRSSVPPSYIHCYIPERDPMTDFNVSYTIACTCIAMHACSNHPNYLCNWLSLPHAPTCMHNTLIQNTERLTEDQRLLANFSAPMQRVMLYEAEHFEGRLNQTLHEVWDRVVNLLHGLENVTGVPLPSNVMRPGTTTAPPTNPQRNPANRNTAPGSVSVGKACYQWLRITGITSFFVCRTMTTMVMICLTNFRFVNSVACFKDKSLLLLTCKSSQEEAACTITQACCYYLVIVNTARSRNIHLE